MAKQQHQDSASAIEDVVSELHRRGVERGEQEYERLVAEARKEAANIVAQAEAHRESLTDEGRREAERLVAAAQAEAEQLLRAFIGSLADIFNRRATNMLEALSERSFAGEREADSLRQIVAALDPDKVDRLRQWLERADPQSFLEGLLILAIVFYSDGEGFAHFQIDADLRSRLARILADPELEPGIAFEFRRGITGFRVSRKAGREVEVSEESLKHMAEIWAGDEFRQVLTRILAGHSLPGASRDA